jgi:hypothetical protein
MGSVGAGFTLPPGMTTVSSVLDVEPQVNTIVDLHDLFMILYLLLTIPWMLLSTQNATSTKSRRQRLVIVSRSGLRLRIKLG